MTRVLVYVESRDGVVQPITHELINAARKLARYGVEVMTGAKVTAIDAAAVTLERGRIEAACVVWGAGVKAAELISGLPGDHDRAGRAIVGPDLALPGHPEIFVIGDAAAVISAIENALSPFDVRISQMPVMPHELVALIASGATG